MLRAGIIGCGGITERRHGPVLAGMPSRVTVVAVADVSEERLALMGERLNVGPDHRFRDYEAMLGAEALDLVHICTPHHLHEPQAVAAMQAGADVMLEKPIATTLNEADRIIAAAGETGRRLTVSHNQLFTPVHRAATGHIAAGDIGDVFLIRSEGLSPSHVVGRGADAHWRTSPVAGGGGPLIDNGYHQIYCAVDYLQSPVKRVYARIGNYIQDIDVEDMALLLMEHENGATTSLQVGWCAPAGGVRVQEIYGTQGQIRLGSDPPAAMWQNITGSWTTLRVEEEGHDEVGFPTLTDAFINAIENDSPVPVPATASRHVLAIIAAAYESGDTGRPMEISV